METLHAIGQDAKQLLLYGKIFNLMIPVASANRFALYISVFRNSVYVILLPSNNDLSCPQITADYLNRCNVHKYLNCNALDELIRTLCNIEFIRGHWIWEFMDNRLRKNKLPPLQTSHYYTSILWTRRSKEQCVVKYVSPGHLFFISFVRTYDGTMEITIFCSTI